MVELRRTKQGNFKIEESSTINNPEIIKIEEILKDYYKVEIDGELYRKISNGVKIKNEDNKNIVVFTHNKEVIAIYKKENEYLKPYKMF